MAEYRISTDEFAGALETIGEMVDKCENLAMASQLPLPPRLHLEQLQISIGEIASELRAAYVTLTGDDPWSDDDVEYLATEQEAPDA